MPPNTPIKLIKRFHNTRQNSRFEEEVQGCKDESGLEIIDFWTGCPVIKDAIFGKIWNVF